MASHGSQRSLSQHLGQDQGSPPCILAEKGRVLGKSAHALGIHTGFTASGPTSCPSQTTVTHIGGPSSVLRRFPDISQKSMRSHWLSSVDSMGFPIMVLIPLLALFSSLSMIGLHELNPVLSCGSLQLLPSITR